MRIGTRALLLPLVPIVPTVLLAGCGTDPGGPGGPGRPAADAAPAANLEWFVDRADESGLDFVHVNGMSGKFYLPEVIGAGVALFDYDNDGDLDAYFVQSGTIGGAPVPPPDAPPPANRGDRLYRNDLNAGENGARTPRFTDVTDRSGIVSRGYGMGVAAGDIDNDGCVDLYLTRFGGNQMFRNNCDGTFTDASKQSGTGGSGWGVSASFLDFDRDGWLDLYVGNYLNYRIEADIPCFSVSGSANYCNPDVYRPQPDRLYRNAGGGRFVDVTAKALVPVAFGPALGVVAADFDGDGWTDIYVANDGQENQLWMNQRDGTFRNTGLLSGSALNAAGRPEASMGVDAGDFDNDGDEDLFMTHLTGETNTTYVNDGTATFEDATARTALGPPSLPYTGFGTAWIDFDNDGWLDILAVNGAVRIIEALEQARDPLPLHQRNQLFRNLGNGRFDEVTRRAGAVFELSEVSRGAAFGDVDNDGDMDVLVSNNGGPARLLVNNIGNRGHWLGLRLTGRQADMLGARVGIFRDGAPTLWRRAHADGSYASANDPRVLAGLGDLTQTPRVRVVWPGGRTEEWNDVAIDRWTTLRVLKEGGGR